MGTSSVANKSRSTTVQPLQLQLQSSGGLAADVGYPGQYTNLQFSTAFTLSETRRKGNTIVIDWVAPTTVTATKIVFTPTTAPASPSNGTAYYDSTTQRIETYDGVAWQIYVSRADLNGNILPASLTTLSVSGNATVTGTFGSSGLGSFGAVVATPGTGTLGSVGALYAGKAGASGGNPVNSGNVQTWGISRFRSGNAVLDIGGYAGAGGYWAQVCDATSLGVNYPLTIQPNGGATTIGGSMTVSGALSYTNPLFDNGTQSANYTVNFANGVRQRLQLGAAITISVSNLPVGVAVTLKIIQGGTAFAPTWSGIKWAGGTAPAVNYINSINLITLLNDGTDILGSGASNYA